VDFEPAPFFTIDHIVKSYTHVAASRGRREPRTAGRHADARATAGGGVRACTSPAQPRCSSLV